MKQRTFVLCLILLLSIALALPAFAFAQSGEQPKQEPAQKKKPRRVWTNDDFSSGAAPAEEKKEEAKPGEPTQSPEALFAELDQARADLANWEKTLELYRKQYEGEVQRQRDADNDYDRDAYRRSVEAAAQVIADTEQKVADLKARIAELERLTAGMKRPARKPGEAAGQNPPGTPVTEGATEVVMPGAGPIPTKEPPPPPPEH